MPWWRLAGQRGKLGVTIQPVTADIAASLGLREIRGALVSDVAPNGPARRAGVLRGDVIIKFNGFPVEDSNSLRNHIASTLPGAAVTLTVLRDGRERELRAILDELVAADQSNGNGEDSTAGSGFGMSLEPVTPATAAQLGLPRGASGLLVTQVDPSGAAADAGLQKGDVVIEVNRQPVHSVAEFNRALKRAAQRPALLLVNRNGTDLYLTLRPHS